MLNYSNHENNWKKIINNDFKFFSLIMEGKITHLSRKDLKDHLDLILWESLSWKVDANTIKEFWIKLFNIAHFQKNQLTYIFYFYMGKKGEKLTYYGYVNIVATAIQYNDYNLKKLWRPLKLLYGLPME